jgi:hypothetical protein
MRRIAIALTVVGTMLLGAGSAQAGVLSSSGGIITYTANQGEKNDVLVDTDVLFGGTVPVYTVKDADANPITTIPPCEFINGVATCRPEGVSSFIVDVRDRDDTAQIAETVGLGALMIGGRGNDTLMGGLGGDILKGNDNRDSLRGRQGTDTYKGAVTTCRRSTASRTPSSPVVTATATWSERTGSTRRLTIASPATAGTPRSPTRPLQIFASLSQLRSVLAA